MNSKQSATLYTILAVFLLILGFVKDEPFAFVGAILVAGCSFYWIFKAYK